MLLNLSKLFYVDYVHLIINITLFKYNYVTTILESYISQAIYFKEKKERVR